MNKTLIVAGIVLIAAAGECRAEDVELDQLTTNQEIREAVTSGEKKVQPSERFKAKLAERKMSVPQIQSRQHEMKVTTDMSTPKFTSRQREMKITDHGAQQIRAPRFKSADIVSVHSGVGQRSLANTGQVNNMQLNYMGKIMEGRVDYLVNTADR
jgi:hypothetical protein